MLNWKPKGWTVPFLLLALVSCPGELPLCQERIEYAFAPAFAAIGDLLIHLADIPNRQMIEVGAPSSVIKSFDPEVDCGLFAAVALDLILDSLSLVE